MAERSYPTSEVRGGGREEIPHVRGRGSGRECQAATAQEQLRGATLRPRSGAEAGRTPCPRGGGQEELPHVRGQGWQLRVPGCDSPGAAERSYPTSEVRGRSREDTLPKGWWPRGATSRPRSGAAAGRSYRRSEVRGSSREALPCVQDQGWQPRGATPCPRPGATAETSNPTSKEQRVHGHMRA